MKCLFVALIVLYCASVPTSVLAAVWSIKYSRLDAVEDKRHEYPIALLKMALDATGVQYEFVESERLLSQEKALRQLKENRDINVVWSMTNEQREQDLLPIRIPITKGLIGWRVAFIREADKHAFAAVSSFKNMQDLVAVQSRDWPDTKILQANGFTVVAAEGYTGSLEALLNTQADFFPRSVVEVFDESRSLSKQIDVLTTSKQSITPNIKVVLDDKFILYYPAAMYFFVNKSNRTLARLIETGLKRSIASGQFETLFMEYFKSSIEQIELQQRQVFRLSNPHMPKDTPINDSSLWLELQ